MLPENEYTVVDDRMYINPNVALQEQTDFITNLRDVQQQNNAQINADTRNLGTDIASSMGGLVGGEGYFTSRYQVPQTAALVADLRATAQAQALSDALKNEQSKWKQRYNNASRAARKRNRGGGGGTIPELPTDIGDNIVIESGDFTAVPERLAQEMWRKEYLGRIAEEKKKVREQAERNITGGGALTPTFQGSGVSFQGKAF